MKFAIYCLLLALCAAETGLAGTLYVETFGQNNLGCSKSEPCSTIEYTLAIAGTNDRVLVGPGIYSEGLLRVGSIGNPVHRVKLQSVAGASSVLVLSNQNPMLQVYGDKFTLGGKAKGLNFRATSLSEFQLGASIQGENVKIEGNFFDNQDSASGPRTAAAIRIDNSAGKNTIRYNRISGFSTGIFLDIDGTSKSIISENEIADSSNRCVYVFGVRGSDKITRNIMHRCTDPFLGSGAAIFLRFTDTANPGASKPKLVRNRIFNLGHSSGIFVDEARPTITRNLLSGLSMAISLTDNFNAVVKDNLIQNSDMGINLSTSTIGTVIQGNTMANLGIHLNFRNPTTTKAKSITRNNFLIDQGGSYCPIELQSQSLAAADPDIVFSRNFWGDLDNTFNFEPDLAGSNGDCSNSNTLNTYNAGNLVFNNPATKAYPVKYKGDGAY